MKRYFLLCSILVALCFLAYADVEVVDLGAVKSKKGVTTSMDIKEIQAEIKLEAEKTARREYIEELLQKIQPKVPIFLKGS